MGSLLSVKSDYKYLETEVLQENQERNETLFIYHCHHSRNVYANCRSNKDFVKCAFDDETTGISVNKRLPPKLLHKSNAHGVTMEITT